MNRILVLFGVYGILTAPALAQEIAALERALLSESTQSLATAAQQSGDAKRGAVVFHQPYLTCIRCHTVDGSGSGLGPDLASGERRSAAETVDAVLRPSKQVDAKYQTVVLVDDAGRTHSGLLVKETAESIHWREIEHGRLRRMLRTELAAIERSPKSIMPDGLTNQLVGRQQFLDLIRYLLEIRQGGARRALELQPPVSLLAARPLPEYESRIDHAGMIASLDETSFERGEEIYRRVCANCHGDHERPGSLPTSLRFASGKFKNGHDPYAIYQTLTRGFGMMAPQIWMVPQQKYDVTHYIREAYLRSHNADQYAIVDESYLEALPSGSTFGPEPSRIVPWIQMDYGMNQIATYEIGDDRSNFAFKGNAIRLDAGPGGVSRGNAFVVYDTDTMRVAAGWTGPGFIDWQCIHYDGQHNKHPRIVGELAFETPEGPGWARPGSRSRIDPRFLGRDGRPYGPLPRTWARYDGMYYYGEQVVLAYRVGDTQILETPSVSQVSDRWLFQRTLNVGPRKDTLFLVVADLEESDEELIFPDAPDEQTVVVRPREHEQSDASAELLAAGIHGTASEAEWVVDDHCLLLKLPAGNQPLRLGVWLSRVSEPDEAAELVLTPALQEPVADLQAFTQGGRRRWPETLTADVVVSPDDAPLAVDVFDLPVDNPWFCRLRLTGIDFYEGGDVALVTSWDGSVWRVSGLSKLPQTARRLEKTQVTWQRIASGLFQPLGVKIVDGAAFVTCRDQICILHDLNGDHEIDYFENFNNDHQVTDHFHEFAMGLQVDGDGNFYYAKSARHALPAVVPHHGTLLRIPPDGSHTEIVAKGFRAANGVCLNEDGTFIVTDQEGHWNPKNRINWVKAGGFYGNMLGYHNVLDPADELMEQPLCWITNEFDRSPAELLWVDSEAWGPLQGSLLNLSYGYGKIYVVPHEEVAGRMQGGMTALPISDAPTGLIRGRFHPHDGQLYACGMFAWAGSRQQPGGLYRIRYTGRPVHTPVRLHARRDGMQIGFTAPLDRASAEEPANYRVKVWSLRRTAKYGSDHHDERELAIDRASLGPDGKTVSLEIPEMAPLGVWKSAMRFEPTKERRWME